MLCVTPGRYVGYMFGSATIDQLESTVVEAEAAISRLRAIQVDAMHQLDEAGRLDNRQTRYSTRNGAEPGGSLPTSGFRSDDPSAEG